jgi:hypothetical protein
MLRTRTLVVAVLTIVVAGCVGSGDVQMPIPLIPVYLLYQGLNNDVVGTIGPALSNNSQGEAHPVSERFGTNELHQVYERLSSEQFQGALTNFSCGDPVPPLKFRMTLYKDSKAKAGARRVEVFCSPGFSPSAGRLRCLMFGLSYLEDKAFAEIDPAGGFVGRKPHCDCDKRDSEGEWVTFPGPD